MKPGSDHLIPAKKTAGPPKEHRRCANQQDRSNSGSALLVAAAVAALLVATLRARFTLILALVAALLVLLARRLLRLLLLLLILIGPILLGHGVLLHRCVRIAHRTSGKWHAQGDQVVAPMRNNAKSEAGSTGLSSRCENPASRALLASPAKP